jgi:hypothetical protein
MDIKYKIVSIEEAQELDFSELEQDSIETARTNIDGTKIVISGEKVEGVTKDEIQKQLTSPEWVYEA